MALTIKMRIDEQPEHSYVFSTGDGEQIELIPLSVVQNGSYTAPDGKAYNIVTVEVPETELEHLNITENGTYTAEDGTAYDVVTVNVEPILEAVSRSYTVNGTYTIVPSEGNDGISEVTVNVDVPAPTPVLENIQDAITQNGQYTYTPSVGYDGIEQVDISVNVSGGGGSSNVVTGTFTPSDGASQSFSTGHTGVVRAIFIVPVDKTVLDNSSISNITRAYSAFNIGTGNSSYFWKLETHRTSTSGTTLAANAYYQVQTNSAQGGAPSNCVGISSDGGTIYYRGKSASVSGTYGFLTTATYQYMIVYDS